MEIIDNTYPISLKSDKNFERLKSLEFKCQRCSNCCRHQPGVVFLSEEDVKNIASFLNIDISTLLSKYCRAIYRNGEQIVALQERKNFDCIFWNDGCIIYPARPLQCKTYPFWPSLVESEENWKEEKKRCPGIDTQGDLKLEEKIDFYLKEKNVKYMKII
ncbi:MAG TPA: YkgJ family cysteine cluster protein [Spirochaetota bacterium]|nr:YkgJ family cysteine cluster protein [Spirochaetota bacterium]HOL56167.1 YkgJ family cysteine cluster protein [Spirochaetota bacterium]HPP03616.1 YkgJ family cysteine cluster protein [Spirochaetota bacterium]